MVLPFLLPAAAAFVGRMLGKADVDERLELVKQLANVTPEQAQAIDAVKKQSISELRTRVKLGIGPLAPLPAQASQRAQDIRQGRIDAAGGIPITPEERAQVASASDQRSAVDALVDKKMAELKASL